MKKREKPGTSNHLKKLRSAAGLSRAALARLADVNERTVKRIERGQSSAAHTRHKILNGLNSHTERKYTYKEVYPHDSEVD